MTAALQPLLHDALVVLRAPTQVWSAADGGIHAGTVHGIYHSDVRLVKGLRITVDGEPPEHLGSGGSRSDAVRIDSLVRPLDDATPDPGVRLRIDRLVEAGGVGDTMTIVNRRAVPVRARIVVALEPDGTPIDLVKLGTAANGTGVGPTRGGNTTTWSSAGVTAELRAPDFQVETGAALIRLLADVEVPADGTTQLRWHLQARDTEAVVQGVDTPVPWSIPVVRAGDDRLARWIARALADLDGLRMSTVREPGLQFVAAGAPWFFTLFGRDSIWTARFLLPLGTELAGSTLRVLAGLQGSRIENATAEEPGKIMHELRRGTLALDGVAGGAELPPLYYGTVDATALWVILLADAWRWGLPDDQVRALLPNLRAALAWMRDFGDADGDGLLEYIDRSGRGLANQGWKDSGDSVQWRDGSLADGPIALAEVQGYAYEAAMRGAELLDAFDAAGGDEWRSWADRLRIRFREKFWIDDAHGPYPAIALDAAKRPVDTVTSNLGHLLGTGILDADEVDRVVRRLTDPSLDSGYGLRTMSTESDGYWPLSYHGGSVWAHDTAIAVLGLAREGRAADASALVEGLLQVAAAFDYRMPELHSGDPASEVATALPYPAACRPQAWSAAASVAVLTAVLGLEPDGGDLSCTPLESFGAMTVQGLRVGAREVAVNSADPNQAHPETTGPASREGGATASHASRLMRHS